MALTKNQLKFLAALRENLGIVSKAANACKMHRNSHFNWVRESPQYKEEAEAIMDECLDVVENAMLEKIIEERDTALIIFYMKTKGKKRGYIERIDTGLVDKNGELTNPPKQIMIIAGKEIEF